MAGDSRMAATVGVAMRAARRRLISAFASAAIALFALLSFTQSAAAKSVVRLEDAGQAAAVFFLLETRMDTGASLDDMRDWYAEEVIYYGRGVQDRALVLTDIKFYIDQWPNRELRPDLATLVVTTVEDGMYELAIEADYNVSNDESSIEGRTTIELTVKIEGNVILITRESGRVLSRRTAER